MTNKPEYHICHCEFMWNYGNIKYFPYDDNDEQQAVAELSTWHLIVPWRSWSEVVLVYPR
jgi:hypothetical protein